MFAHYIWVIVLMQFLITDCVQKVMEINGQFTTLKMFQMDGVMIFVSNVFHLNNQSLFKEQ